MDWPDDEFEAFLGQFRPRKPKALPGHRRRVVAMAAAAVTIAAVVVAMRYGSKGPVAGDSTQTPASTSSTSTDSVDGMGRDGRQDMRPAATLTRVPGAKATLPDAKTITASASAPPALSSNRGGKPSGSPTSNGPMNAAKGAVNRRFRVGKDVEAPIKLVDVRPVFPEDARAAGIEGVIILGIVIGEDGSVIEASVLRSIPELDQAAIDAVSQWQFEPTLLINGEPVEVEMHVMINFTLQ